LGHILRPFHPIGWYRQSLTRASVLFCVLSFHDQIMYHRMVYLNYNHGDLAPHNYLTSNLFYLM
jgi:hypothetical protein